MVQKYDVPGAELGGDVFYEDWVEVVRYEDYVKLELKLRRLAKQVIDRQCDWKTYELAREIIDL